MNIWHISRILDQICVKILQKAESPVMKEVIQQTLRLNSRYSLPFLRINALNIPEHILMTPSENSSNQSGIFQKAIQVHGNSSQVTSNQVTIHPDLEKLVKKYQKSRYLVQKRESREFDSLIQFLNQIQNQLPIVLDSGCGTGDSSITLARMFPNKFIVGFDKSIHRLSKTKQPLPSNLLITQQNCEDIWSSLAENNIKCDTYLLHQNPWPKKKHIKRRWHAHPIFPSLLQISRSITMRTNWRIYALEFSVALTIHNIPHKLTPLPSSTNYLSPFERKYLQSKHVIYEITSSNSCLN